MAKSDAQYRPQLDGLRAFCILLTVGHHTPGMPAWFNGSMGVDIFFALSGWLITTLLLTERRKSGRIRLGAFYIRRAFRIVPLYMVTLAGYVAAALALNGLGKPLDWVQLQQAFPYLATFNSEYRPEAAGNIFGHAWTLGVEEKFYLLWPALLLLAGRRTWIAIAASAVASGVLVAIGDESGYLLRGYMGIGFGSLLALAANRFPAVVGMLSRPALAPLSLAIFALAYGLSIAAPFASAWNILASFAGALLVANLWFEPGTATSRALSFLPIQFAGKLTYGMYLTHVLALNAVNMVLAYLGLGGPAITFVACYATTLVGSYVLYRIVERPMIDWGRKLAGRPGQPVLAESQAAP